MQARLDVVGNQGDHDLAAGVARTFGDELSWLGACGRRHLTGGSMIGEDRRDGLPNAAAGHATGDATSPDTTTRGPGDTP